MQSCEMHASGALLLPFLRLPAHMLAVLPAVPTGAGPRAVDAIAAVPGEESDDDDNDGGMPDQMGDDSWEETLEPFQTDDLIDTEDVQGIDAGPDGNPDVPGTPRPSSPQPAGEAAAAAPPRDRAPAFDPWAPLDPHDASGAALRPFRRGRTYSAVEQVTAAEEEPAENEVDAEKENAAGSNPPDRAFLQRLGLAGMSHTAGHVPLKQPLWGQFEAMHTAEMKRRAQCRRLQRLKAAEKNHVDLEAQAAPEIEAADILPNRGKDLDHEQFPVVDGEEPDVPNFDLDDDDTAPMADNDDYDDEQLTEELGRAALRGETSYEEQCRAHVESCFEASASYQEDMDLHRRVDEWQARVGPMLEQQTNQGDFNIRLSCERLLENFSKRLPALKHAKYSEEGGDAEVGTKIEFAAAAQSEEKFEVCRMFMAALELAKKGNLDLSTEGNLEDGNQALYLRLLKKDASFDVSQL